MVARGRRDETQGKPTRPHRARNRGRVGHAEDGVMLATSSDARNPWIRIGRWIDDLDEICEAMRASLRDEQSEAANFAVSDPDVDRKSEVRRIRRLHPLDDAECVRLLHRLLSEKPAVAS